MKSNPIFRTNGLALFFFIFMAMIYLTCSNDKSMVEEANGEEDALTISSDKSQIQIFHKSVGAPISRALGDRWIENYRNKNLQSFSYSISVDIVSKLLSNPEAVGIMFFNAIDSNGERHVIPIAIQSTGDLVRQNELAIVSGKLEWQLAFEFINNYKGAVKSHFFGANALANLCLKPAAKELLIAHGVDEKGSDQLLLSTDSATDAEPYTDASFPCPPYCQQD